MTTIDASRQLICLGPRLEAEIRLSRRLLEHKERLLGAVRRDYACLVAELEDFFDGQYWPKVGRYLSLADRLWDRFLGKPRPARSRPRAAGPSPSTAPETADPAAAKSVKELYRELARRYHPDRAPEAERAFYAGRMAAVNRAFDKGDVRELEHLLRLSAAEVGGGPADPLERLAVLRDEGRSLGSFIALYEGRIVKSKTGAIFRMMAQVRKRASEGADLLAEMGLEQKSRAKRYRDLLRRTSRRP